jgi:hypothetical protein
MREEIISQWQREVDGSPADGHSTDAGRGNPLSTPDGPAAPPGHGAGPYLGWGTLYAVEVCWLSGGAVTCRTYPRPCGQRMGRRPHRLPAGPQDST